MQAIIKHSVNKAIIEIFRKINNLNLATKYGNHSTNTQNLEVDYNQLNFKELSSSILILQKSTNIF
jgi:hypothetical protein